MDTMREIMRSQGHISPTTLARKVQADMPGVNASTIYRTLSMLEEMGVKTGVDLSKLIAASTEAQGVLGRPLGAHLLTAGPVEWQPPAAAS